MTERITLRGKPEDAGAWVEVVIDPTRRWPVKLIGANNGSAVDMSDDEAIHLMRVLQKRYPLEALVSE